MRAEWGKNWASDPSGKAGRETELGSWKVDRDGRFVYKVVAMIMIFK